MASKIIAGSGVDDDPARGVLDPRNAGGDDRAANEVVGSFHPQIDDSPWRLCKPRCDNHPQETVIIQENSCFLMLGNNEHNLSPFLELMCLTCFFLST